MRKILKLAVVCSLLAFGLTGCGGGGSDDGGSSSSSSSFFTSLFSASSNSEPASISSNSAGAVDPNAEPHDL